MIRKTNNLIWRSQILNAVIVGLTVIFTVLAKNVQTYEDEADDMRVNHWFKELGLMILESNRVLSRLLKNVLLRMSTRMLAINKFAYKMRELAHQIDGISSEL